MLNGQKGTVLNSALVSAASSRLLQGFIQTGSQPVVESGKLEALLGIIQKRIASKSDDHQGFYLLQSMIEFLPREALVPFISKIFLIFEILKGRDYYDKEFSPFLSGFQTAVSNSCFLPRREMR